MLPDWLDRTETMEIDVYGRIATIVCPRIEDVIVAKLHRLVEKGVTFIKACAKARPNPSFHAAPRPRVSPRLANWADDDIDLNQCIPARSEAERT